jgi:hypothetical protein
MTINGSGLASAQKRLARKFLAVGAGEGQDTGVQGRRGLTPD